MIKLRHSSKLDARETMLEEVPLRNLNGEEEDDDEYDGNGEKRKSSTQDKRPWDKFLEIPPKQDSGSQGRMEFIELSIRLLKLLAYLVTFLLVLVGGVAAKAGFLLITSQLKPMEKESCLDDENKITSILGPLVEERVLWTWVLLFLLFVPEIETFLRAARICFFKINKFPDFPEFAILAFMETLHVVGVSILIFEVLPNLDVIRGVMLTNAVCFIPGLLKLLTRNTSEPYGLIKIFADAVSVFFQFTALIIWPLYEQSARMGFIAPALLLASCGWWLNYIPNYSTKGKGFLAKFLTYLSYIKLKINDNTLYWTYFIISIWKMLVYFVSMLVILSVQGYDLTEFFDNTDLAFKTHHFTGLITKMISHSTLAVYENAPLEYDSGEMDWLYVAIVVCAGAYVCYVFSKFACKILIQEISMAIPTILVVPATIALLVILNTYQNADVCFSQNFLPPYIFWNFEAENDFINDKLAWVWIFWLVSQVWITFHIWIPQCERLARTEKIFVTPMYSGFLVDQSICMNRTIDEEIVRSPEDADILTDDDNAPNVIACATMWHESKEEMVEMFKSILRMDLDQCARKAAKEMLNSASARNNFYNFETHIFFDDAYTLESDGASMYVINSFVRDMLKSLPEAVREVHANRLHIRLEKPKMYPTPYGGRLTYTLPGGTILTIHLKDKQKIRHRKRWSQCMYMYYLLGYRLMSDTNLTTIQKEVRAHNTYLLALDGDIDFQPKAVQLLVDLMKKNDNLGAACGRIHPVGTGLMYWYQLFEYAIGHWLQKATEHMIGCVLCSPGCFSLFRGKALMDDNVMKTYTKDCEAAADYVQYDQGEDRWLCTLLLQQGYRVEYSAASDAFTHCPESFNEFYNQRRRWVPSTMANIMDLLGSYKRTIEINRNISFPYIIYQTMLLGGTILGPGTIFLMLVGAFVAAFKIDNWTAFYYNLIPILLFIGICLFLKSNLQLIFALVISTVYGLIMMAVLVGLLIQIQQDGPLAPSTLFLFIVAGEIIVAGLMHPQEVYCLPSGTIYYITIPSMYLLLIIYSVCNLNVVSWGTREVAEKKTKEQLEEEQKAAQSKGPKPSNNPILAFLESIAPSKGKETGSIDFSFAGLFRCMLCTQPQDFDEKEHLLRIGESLVNVNKRLDSIERCVDPTAPVQPSRRRTTISHRASTLQMPSNISDSISEIIADDEIEEEEEIPRDDLMNPYWIEDYDLRKAKTKFLRTEEVTFWREMIDRYLKPIDKNVVKEQKIAGELKELRDKTVLAFFMLNALFVTIIFLLQLNKDTIYINWPLGVKSNITYDPTSQEVTISQEFLQLEPIGLIFVIFFAIILVIQFTGMFLHRFETLCHVLSTTTILPVKENGVSTEEVVERVKQGKNENEEPMTTEEKIEEMKKSKRSTVQRLEDVYQHDRPTVTLSDEFQKRFSKIAEEDELEEEERLRRKSRTSVGFGGRLSRRFSTSPGSNVANRRMTSKGLANPAFSSIPEGEETAAP